MLGDGRRNLHTIYGAECLAVSTGWSITKADISLPEVGPVLVAGKSLGTDSRSPCKKISGRKFRDISADVSLSHYAHAVRIYVTVRATSPSPAPYDVSSLSTPLNALFAAGGPTARGSLRILKHLSEGRRNWMQDVDVYDLLLHGVKGKMERLESGDTVMVPPLVREMTIRRNRFPSLTRQSRKLRSKNRLRRLIPGRPEQKSADGNGVLRSGKSSG